jgi:hypothetical protein
MLLIYAAWCDMTIYNYYVTNAANITKTSSNIYSYHVIEQETNEMTSGRTLLTLIQ